MSEDNEAREDELLALASIYDGEEFHRAESAQGGEIQLCLELPAAFKIAVKGTAASGAWWQHKCTIKARLTCSSIVVVSILHSVPARDLLHVPLCAVPPGCRFFNVFGCQRVGV